MNTYYLARHGQTLWNTLGQTQGHGNSPLTDLGKQQAKDLAEALKAYPIDVIYCSDLGRAVETAEIIANELKLQLHPTESLREMGFGIWEGMPLKEIEKTYPESFAMWRNEPDKVKIEGGETLPDSGEEDGELDTFIVSSLPQEDAIWGYFYLWKLEKISTDKAKAIIISPDQYYRLTHEAISIIKEYEIDGISNWRVLSIEEAKAFKNQFADNMGDFNDFLKSNGLSPFYYSEGRYLCNDCQSTFGITSSRILAAGQKTKYYLRPVKTILLKVQKQ